MQSSQQPIQQQINTNSSDGYLKQIGAALIFRQHTQIVQSAYKFIITFGSWFVLPLGLRKNFGARAFPFLWILFGTAFLYLAWGISDVLSGMPLVNIRLDLSLFYIHSRIFFFFGLFHFFKIKYRLYIKKKRSYSYSTGASNLWPYFKKLKIPFLTTELRFQLYVEPLIILIVGIVIKMFLSASYGNFLMFCGLCVFALGQHQLSHLLQKVYDITDGELIQNELSGAMELEIDDMVSEHQSGDPFINKVTLNTVANQVKNTPPLDNEIEKLKKEQNLG